MYSYFSRKIVYFLFFIQIRPHEAAPPPPIDVRENRENRDFRDSSRESTLRELKDVREIRENRERERDSGRDRERDRERDRDRENSTREKRNIKPEVPMVPLVDHRSGEEKQRPRSSQELKHPRSATLSGVILPLLSDVSVFKFIYFNILNLKKQF